MNDGRLSPSGEHLLSCLVDFIDRRGPDLMSGKIALELHPRALEYVAARVQYFQELESLKVSSPVDYFRGAFSNLEDYKRLEKLQHVLQRVKRLRLLSVVYRCRDPTRINLTGLWSLTSLELRSCDLSTSVVAGLEALQGTLTHLSCSDSLEKLQHLLAPYSRTGSSPPAPWPRLHTLACTHNSFMAMDASLTLAPALRTLRLGNNNIGAAENLQAASALTELQLSHNRLAAVALLAQCPGPLAKLHLQGNAISSTRGLQSLRSLVELDIRFNLLASLHEVRRLSGLSQLRSLSLEGNPLAHAPFYRIDALACLPQHAAGLSLDGRTAKRAETDALAVHSLLGAPDLPGDMYVMARYIDQPDHWAAHTSGKATARPAAVRMQEAAKSAFPESPPSSQASVPGSSHRPVRRVVDLGFRNQSLLSGNAESPRTSSVFQPFMRSRAHANFEASRYTLRRRSHSSRRSAHSLRYSAAVTLAQLGSLPDSPMRHNSSSMMPLNRAVGRDVEASAASADLDSLVSSSLHGSSASSLASSPSVSPVRMRPAPAAQAQAHAVDS